MTTADRRELSYDGKGINGPDEHRSRIATFANAEAAEKYGKLFESAPELLDALLLALPYVEMAEHDDAYKPGVVAKMVRTMRAAITKAQSHA